MTVTFHAGTRPWLTGTAILSLAVALALASCGDKVQPPTGGGVPTDLGQVQDSAADSLPDSGGATDGTSTETLGHDTADVPPADEADQADADAQGYEIAIDADVTATEDADDAVDSQDASDAAEVSLTTCPGAADCDCTSDAECGSGLCAEHKNGTRTCAGPCDSGGKCPAGLTCNTVTGKDAAGKDLCVEGDLRLCDPCSTDADCQVPGGSGAACITVPGQGHFCGMDCINDKNCPLGYKCLDGIGSDQGVVKQCMPAAGAVCNCTPLAVSKKLKTACSQQNDAGTCTGERACAAAGEPGAPDGGGLTPCSAQVPASDTCNGMDDDCDGTTDGGVGCDDKNACTIDTCAGVAGCTHQALSGACDDGNACTQGDACIEGACKGSLLACDDQNPCTKDSCDITSGCTTTPDDGAPCDDGNACTQEACAAGLCAQTTLTCDDGNACTQDACDPAVGCTATANDDNACDDQNACTSDKCLAGKCISKTNAPCDDGDKCTADGCDPDKGCTALPLPAVACDDKNECTKDSCDSKLGCVHEAVPGCAGGLPYLMTFPCGDPSLATWKLDAPVTGVGWGIDAAPNPPGYASPACSLNYNNGTSYDNGTTNSGAATSPEFDTTKLPANSPLVLTFQAGGSYESGSYYDLLVVQASTDNTLWSTLQAKEEATTKLGPFTAWTKRTVDLKAYAGKKFRIRFQFNTMDSVANSTTGPFIDDVLIVNATCAKDLDCDDMNPCTTDTCGAGGVCSSSSNTAPCDDANPCTLADTCALGTCKGTAKVCDDKNPCTTDGCDAKTGACIATPLVDGTPCSDGNACTIGDVCVATTCVSKPKCDDGNACTQDACDPVTLACTAVNLADGTTCTDVDACTGGDACSAGKCMGQPGTACSPLVDEPFGCGAASAWAVSPAVAATQTGWQVDANPSPPAWHSASCSLNFNNGATLACPSGGTKVAGTATSPLYDASGSSDAVLQFYSYADVGTNLYVNKRWVEASTDGFQSLAFAVALPNEATVNKAWVLHKFDAKALAGQAFQVRFRFDSVSCAATSTQGWFVDDLRITTDKAKGCAGDAECADGDACTDNTCAGGQCALAWNVTACDDGNACTTGDKCDGKGGCTAGPAVVCNDNNACTSDSCNPITGCAYTNTDGATCSDGNDCTSGDACKAGKCAPGANTANGTACNDGEVCTSPDVCTSGVCGGKNACDDGNACTIDSCAKGANGAKTCASIPLAENTPCDDGQACTAGDTCLAGKCASYQACGDSGFSDSFPCGSNGSWTFDASPGNGVQWKIDGKPTPLAGGVNAWQSPSCSLNFNNDVSFDSGTNSNGSATSAPVQLPTVGPATIEFASYFDTETGNYYDQRWLDLLDPTTNAVVGSAAIGYSGDYQDVQKWVPVKVAIPANLLGAKVRLRFRFLTLDSVGNQGTGWFVDDLTFKPSSGGCTVDSDCKDDGNPCTDAVCSAGACIQKPGSTGTACDDGNPCTTASACSGGLCKSTALLMCDDGFACTTDTCDPAKGCVFTPAPAGTCGVVGLPYAQTFACDDAANQLWQRDLAPGGPVWAFDATPVVPGFQSPSCSLNFNDGKDTTCAQGQAAIDASAKSPTFDTSTLKAGTPLTLQFSLAGSWDVATALDLDVSLDGKAWTTLKSYSGQDAWSKFLVNLTAYAGKKFQLRFHYTVAACADVAPGTGPFVDDFKLYSPTCKTDGDCSDGNACTTDTCDAGLCTFPANSATCDDGNVCTSSDACSGGKCGGVLKACDDGNACTADSCDVATGSCVFVAKTDGALCTDGNPCTAVDACSLGKCVGSGAAADGTKCSDGNGCTIGDSCTAGTCSPAGNAFDGSLCSDGDPCTAGDVCGSGVCKAGKPACDDGNPCTSDSCKALDSSSKSCSSTPATDGTACEDGNPCTAGDACSAGSCIGLPSCE